MSGLEKMIRQIEDEARQKAEQILAEADRQAEQIRKDEAAACEQELTKIAEKSTRDIALQQQKSASNTERRQRLALLETKQEIIGDAIGQALKTVQAKSGLEYFNLIRATARRYVRGQAGVIVFSREDLDRMPKSLPSELEKIAAEKGGSLTISDKPRQTDGGFVLIYGGVEENCTFPALFEAHKEQLQDKVHALLFA